jgi:hypothetical protein
MMSQRPLLADRFHERYNVDPTHVTMPLPLTVSKIVVQVCRFVFAAIALSGGSLQFYLGQPDTSPRLDNVHTGQRAFATEGVPCRVSCRPLRC